MLENVSNSFEHVKVPLGYSVTAEWIVFVVDDFKYEMNLFFGKSFQTHITNFLRLKRLSGPTFDIFKISQN